jgi:hypothetical protein
MTEKNQMDEFDDKPTFEYLNKIIKQIKVPEEMNENRL